MSSEIKKVATRLIEKVLLVPNDVAAGVGKIEQKRASGKVEVPLFNPTFFMGNLVVDKYEDLIDSNKINPNHLGDTKVAFAVDKGLFYKYNATSGTWDITSANMPTIDSIDDLKANPTGNTYVIVTDSARGGVFIYDDNYKETNNGGTIINGWVRQYTGGADVKWFGAVGNNQIDDTSAIQKAVNSCPVVLISEGTYKIARQINVPNDVQIIGSGGKLVGSGDITFLKLNLRNTIQNLEINGDTSKVSQVAVLIDGGDNLNGCTNATLINVTISTIGGYGVKVAKNGTTKHLISDCKFINCNYGISIESTGSGLSVTNSLFFNNRYAVQVKGVKSLFSSCIFTGNQNTIYLAEGISGSDSGIKFISCDFDSNNASDITANSYASKNAMFNACNFSSGLYLTGTDKLKFFDCTINGSEIRFANSNDNIFKGCNLIQTNVTNDYNSSKTINHWYDCIEDSVLTPTTCKNGGYLEVTNTEAYSVANETALRVVPFNTIVKNSMPYHENFTKYNFFDLTNNCFDFTQVSNFVGNDLITGCIQLFTTLDQQYIKFYLYQVDSATEVPTLGGSNMDGGKFIVQIPMNWNQPKSTYRSSIGTFTIPRGMYKLILSNIGATGSILANGASLDSGKAVYRARFWGI